MAVQVSPSSVHWWQQFADRVRQPPSEIDNIIRTAMKTPNAYPHIRQRLVLGKAEAYLPGTGLSVWEVVWLHRVYQGDTQAVAAHLSIETHLVGEALGYARTHAAEIEAELTVMEEASEERLRAILPGMKVMGQDCEAKPPQST